ncbi:hypothetical protein CDIK_3062 [Cucumispora dikerogammari]|nr:hypothetical protein CDIK_3062 [Cucumispora dikerogammari]
MSISSPQNHILKTLLSNKILIKTIKKLTIQPQNSKIETEKNIKSLYLILKATFLNTKNTENLETFIILINEPLKTTLKDKNLKIITISIKLLRLLINKNIFNIKYYNETCNENMLNLFKELKYVFLITFVENYYNFTDKEILKFGLNCIFNCQITELFAIFKVQENILLFRVLELYLKKQLNIDDKKIFRNLVIPFINNLQIIGTEAEFLNIIFILNYFEISCINEIPLYILQTNILESKIMQKTKVLNPKWEFLCKINIFHESFYKESKYLNDAILIHFKDKIDNNKIILKNRKILAIFLSIGIKKIQEKLLLNYVNFTNTETEIFDIFEFVEETSLFFEFNQNLLNRYLEFVIENKSLSFERIQILGEFYEKMELKEKLIRCFIFKKKVSDFDIINDINNNDCNMPDQITNNNNHIFNMATNNNSDCNISNMVINNNNICQKTVTNNKIINYNEKISKKQIKIIKENLKISLEIFPISFFEKNLKKLKFNYAIFLKFPTILHKNYKRYLHKIQDFSEIIYILNKKEEDYLKKNILKFKEKLNLKEAPKNYYTTFYYLNSLNINNIKFHGEINFDFKEFYKYFSNTNFMLKEKIIEMKLNEFYIFLSNLKIKNSLFYAHKYFKYSKDIYKNKTTILPFKLNLFKTILTDLDYKLNSNKMKTLKNLILILNNKTINLDFKIELEIETFNFINKKLKRFIFVLIFELFEFYSEINFDFINDFNFINLESFSNRNFLDKIFSENMCFEFKQSVFKEFCDSVVFNDINLIINSDIIVNDTCNDSSLLVNNSNNNDNSSLLVNDNSSLLVNNSNNNDNSSLLVNNSNNNDNSSLLVNNSNNNDSSGLLVNNITSLSHSPVDDKSSPLVSNNIRNDSSPLVYNNSNDTNNNSNNTSLIIVNNCSEIKTESLLSNNNRIKNKLKNLILKKVDSNQINKILNKEKYKTKYEKISAFLCIELITQSNKEDKTDKKIIIDFMPKNIFILNSVYKNINPEIQKKINPENLSNKLISENILTLIQFSIDKLIFNNMVNIENKTFVKQREFAYLKTINKISEIINVEIKANYLFCQTEKPEDLEKIEAFNLIIGSFKCLLVDDINNDNGINIPNKETKNNININSKNDIPNSINVPNKENKIKEVKNRKFWIIFLESIFLNTNINTIFYFERQISKFPNIFNYFNYINYLIDSNNQKELNLFAFIFPRLFKEAYKPNKYILLNGTDLILKEIKKINLKNLNYKIVKSTNKIIIKIMYEILNDLFEINLEIPTDLLRHARFREVLNNNNSKHKNNNVHNFMDKKLNFLLTQTNKYSEILSLWKINMDNKMDGVIDCGICYFIVSVTGEFPVVECKSCFIKYHKSCLNAWRLRSTERNCALCRQIMDY